jgi:hypothetical protein
MNCPATSTRFPVAEELVSSMGHTPRGHIAPGADELPRYLHPFSVAEELVSSWGILLLGQMNCPATSGRFPVPDDGALHIMSPERTPMSPEALTKELQTLDLKPGDVVLLPILQDDPLFLLEQA